VYQGARAFAAESLIYFAAGGRQFTRTEQGIRTEGAVGVAIVPTEHDLPGRAIFCNSRGGSLHESVPTLVYWGGPNGFATDRCWEIPFASGYESSAADLNSDGFVDLVLLNSGHGGRDLGAGHLGANILWGAADGFDVAARRTLLAHFGLWASNVADLNRDGWLDLVLGQFGPDQEGEPEHVIIYYGSPKGYNVSRRTMPPSKGESAGCAVADFNRDAWLDVAVTSFAANRVRIYWGSSDGFTAKRQGRLDVPSPIGLETADLNTDGWLDLIAGGYYDKLAGCHDTGTTIFWGGCDGFQQWNAQWLPGWTATGHVVADWDADGLLDLFCPFYHGQLTRESMPCCLYWGTPDGFDKRCRTILMGDSCDDALAADFNQDGNLDLALVCHTVDGNHPASSRVYYNDGRRFTEPKVCLLPTHGPHWMWDQDMGHIYHRRWEQVYRSSTFHWAARRAGGMFRFKANIPAGSSLAFAIRSATAESKLDHRPWHRVRSGEFQLDPTDRCLQYRALFKSANGDRYPVLDQVTISLVSGDMRRL
jgi:hypothetical protein